MRLRRGRRDRDASPCRYAKGAFTADASRVQRLAVRPRRQARSPRTPLARSGGVVFPSRLTSDGPSRKLLNDSHSSLRMTPVGCAPDLLSSEGVNVIELLTTGSRRALHVSGKHRTQLGGKQPACVAFAMGAASKRHTDPRSPTVGPFTQMPSGRHQAGPTTCNALKVH